MHEVSENEEDDAKDSVQQIFLKVIQELQKYKVEYFKSWVYMVAKNHCLMKLRDKQGKIPVELNEKLTLAPDEETDRQVPVAERPGIGCDGRSVKRTEPRAEAMCNFVLPAKEKLPGNKCYHRLLNVASKKLYPKWQTQSENTDRKKNEREPQLPGNLKDILAQPVHRHRPGDFVALPAGQAV